MQDEQLIGKLSSRSVRARLKASKKLAAKMAGDLTPNENLNYDCQVRTVYSCFSLTPSAAIYRARLVDLPVIGVTDYASLAAMKELRRAAKIYGMPYFAGAEVTVSSEKFPSGISAVALGVPLKRVKAMHAELAKYRELKLAYVGKVADAINAAMKKYGIRVEAPSRSRFHGYKATLDRDALFFNLASAVADKFADEELPAFLEEVTGETLGEEDRAKISDRTNTLFRADLALILSEKLQVRAKSEKCVSIREFLRMCSRYGAIPAAVCTGGDIPAFADKAKAEGFLSVIADSEKFDEQFAGKMKEACLKRDMLPLYRNLVDYPRKKFDEAFSSREAADFYNDCALAVVGNAITTHVSLDDGLFPPEPGENTLPLPDRIKLYSKIGSKGKI